MRPHTPAEAAAVCDTVGRWQDTFLAALGRRLVFAADEYYLMAGAALPAAATYEGFPQHENGLGMARAFEAAFGGDEQAALGVRPGFFAAVDGAPAAGYRAPTRSGAGPAAGGRRAPRSPSSPASTAPGCSARWSTRWAATTSGSSPVANHFFGGNIGVAGLLTGPDLVRVLADEPQGHRYLLPDSCLSEGRFLDDLTLPTCPGRSRWCPTDGLSLRRALERRRCRPCRADPERVPVTLESR